MANYKIITMQITHGDITTVQITHGYDWYVMVITTHARYACNFPRKS